MELVNKAVKVFKKMQKLSDDDFAAQVECHQQIFNYMREMSSEEIAMYNEITWKEMKLHGKK
jgi:hypothetical protein